MNGYFKSTKNISDSSRTFHSPYKTNITLWIGLLTLILLMMAATVSRAGEAITIDNSFLKKHLTQVKNPRLLTIDDIKRQYEKYEMEGWSFVVKGDFNKDGHDDYAIAGKYDGPYNEKSLFVSILTIKNGTITVEFMEKIPFPHDRVFLSSGPGTDYIIENVDKKYNVIEVAMALATDWGWLIAWDGKKYITPKAWARAKRAPERAPESPRGSGLNNQQGQGLGGQARPWGSDLQIDYLRRAQGDVVKFVK